MDNLWTFTFTLDPKLNSGYKEAFNQCGDPYWWIVDEEGNMAVGEVNLTGAVFKSLHDSNIVVVEAKE
jgi:hypothetical protein